MVLNNVVVQGLIK